MGISNDWQVIDNLTYYTVENGHKLMSEESCNKIAAAIGWEVVHLSDYTPNLIIGANTYSAYYVYLLRPVSDTPYDYGISLFARTSEDGDLIVKISNGMYQGKIRASNTCPASIQCLRPTAQGGFCFRVGGEYHFFDQFGNAKTGDVKWGGFNGPNQYELADLYTGNMIYPNQYSYSVDTFAVGGFVALKKATILSADGIYNAKTLYMFMQDYNNYLVKTVELGGVKYVNADGRFIYIRLAE